MQLGSMESEYNLFGVHSPTFTADIVGGGCHFDRQQCLVLRHTCQHYLLSKMMAGSVGRQCLMADGVGQWFPTFFAGGPF